MQATSGRGRGTSIRRACSVVQVLVSRSSRRLDRWGSIGGTASTVPPTASRIPSGNYISSSVSSSNSRSFNVRPSSRGTSRAGPHGCLSAGAPPLRGRSSHTSRRPCCSNQAPGRAAAESLFAREAQPMQEQIKRMSDSLDAMVAAFQKKQATLTPAQRDAQGKELESEAGVVSAARARSAGEAERAPERARAADSRPDQGGHRGRSRRGWLLVHLQRRIRGRRSWRWTRTST